MVTRLVSWNVNGIRAAANKGLFEWMKSSGFDIVCLQETKAQPEQLTEQFLQPDGYHSYLHSAQKKGYSGVAVFTKEEPLSTAPLGIQQFDAEGRAQILEYPGFVLINAYFPNSQDGGQRIGYKIAFCEAIRKQCDSLVREGKHVIVCGDFNIAHKPIDLANPGANEANPGYLPEERAWMESFIEAGYVDTFRIFNKDPRQYTWWSYRFGARARNDGWRIDYHCVDREFAPQVKAAAIHNLVQGSDHCPVSIDVDA